MKITFLESFIVEMCWDNLKFEIYVNIATQCDLNEVFRIHLQNYLKTRIKIDIFSFFDILFIFILVK